MKFHFKLIVHNHICPLEGVFQSLEYLKAIKYVLEEGFSY